MALLIVILAKWATFIMCTATKPPFLTLFLIPFWAVVSWGSAKAAKSCFHAREWPLQIETGVGTWGTWFGKKNENATSQLTCRTNLKLITNPGWVDQLSVERVPFTVARVVLAHIHRTTDLLWGFNFALESNVRQAVKAPRKRYVEEWMLRSKVTFDGPLRPEQTLRWKMNDASK